MALKGSFTIELTGKEAQELLTQHLSTALTKKIIAGFRGQVTPMGQASSVAATAIAKVRRSNAGAPRKQGLKVETNEAATGEK